MSWEKFGKTAYFFNTFNESIDDKLVKKLNNIYFIEFVNFADFYEKIIKNKRNHIFNRFDKPIDKLPGHIKSLVLSYYFNQQVNNLPIKLNKLVFGKAFNQPVNNLPPGLKILIFGSQFNHPVENLPNKIKILSFGICFSHSLDYLPCSITHLEVSNTKLNFDNLPSTIKFIYVCDKKKKNYWNCDIEESELVDNKFINVNPNTKICIKYSDKN